MSSLVVIGKSWNFGVLASWREEILHGMGKSDGDCVAGVDVLLTQRR